MRPALSTVCSLDAPLDTILEEYAAGKCDAVELWLGHVETFLAGRSTDDLRQLLERHGITAVAASFQGGLLTGRGPAAAEHWRHFEARLGLLRHVGIPVLVLAGDVFGPLAPQDVGLLSENLAAAAARAADAGVRLALEFDARASFPNNLQSAVALVEGVGNGSLGVCLDWFHYTIGPSKPVDLGLLSPEVLAHVQLSDIADVPREMATDGDRILPGEGCSPPEDLLRRLGEIGYAGAVSVELHNPQLWRVAPRQFGEIAMTALRRLLGQAGM